MYSRVIFYAQSVIILFQIQINELCLRVLCIFVIKAKALIYFCLPFYLLTRAKKINFLKSLGSFKGQICVARITKYTGENYAETGGAGKKGARKKNRREKRERKLPPKFCPTSLRLFIFRPYSRSPQQPRQVASLCSTSYGRSLLFYFTRTSFLRSGRARAN